MIELAEKTEAETEEFTDELNDEALDRSETTLLSGSNSICG